MPKIVSVLLGCCFLILCLENAGFSWCLGYFVFVLACQCIWVAGSSGNQSAVYEENSRDLPSCFLFSNFERVFMFGLHAFPGFLGKSMSTLPFKATVKFIFKM